MTAQGSVKTGGALFICETVRICFQEEFMKEKDAIKMLKKEKEIIALNEGAYTMFLALGLALLYNGTNPIAKITKGY